MSRSYRPSNGSEGMDFMARFCDRCVHDINQNCVIVAKTLVMKENYPGYPREWITDEQIGPRCTCWQERK